MRLFRNSEGNSAITHPSKDLESAESCGEMGRKVSQDDSRRSTEREREGESWRGESFAKCRENRGQKREQADVSRRRPGNFAYGLNRITQG